MLNKSFDKYGEKIQFIFLAEMKRMFNINATTYQEALEYFKNFINKKGLMKDLSLTVDEFINEYLAVNRYDGDEFSPFYTIGKMPVIMPFALMKLMVDDSESCVYSYINAVLHIVYLSDDEDVDRRKKEIEVLIMDNMGKIVKERMIDIYRFIHKYQYDDGLRYSMLDFILLYFNHVYDVPDSYLVEKLDDMLTSDVLIIVSEERDADIKEKPIYYLYMISIETYLTLFYNDIYKKMDDLDIKTLMASLENAYAMYRIMMDSLTDVSNDIDLSDGAFEVLSEKMMNICSFTVSPKKYLEKNLTDEKSAKALAKFL